MSQSRPGEFENHDGLDPLDAFNAELAAAEVAADRVTRVSADLEPLVR